MNKIDFNTKFQIDITLEEFIFPGFYNTFLDYENFLDEDECEIDVSSLNSHENNICQIYVNLLQEKCELNIVSWKLIKPKYYNYHNDELVITVEFTLDSLWKLLSNADSGDLFDMEETINFAIGNLFDLNEHEIIEKIYE